jgi:hypothetical protein
MRLSNGYLVPWPLFLEPWGAKVDLVAGADYDVVAYGSTADHDRLVYDEQRGDWFTVQVEDAGVAIYVSTMTVGLAVFCEGRSVWMWPPSGRAETPSSSAF